MLSYLSLVAAAGVTYDDNLIISPAPGQSLHFGESFELRVTVPSKAVPIAFSVGFMTAELAKQDNLKDYLGRPFVKSISTIDMPPDMNGQMSYIFNLTVPAAKDFLDGPDVPYVLKTANFYKFGATSGVGLVVSKQNINLVK